MTSREGGERRRIPPLWSTIIGGAVVGILMLGATLLMKDWPAARRAETASIKADVQRIDRDLTAEVAAQKAVHESLNRDMAEMKQDIKAILRAVK